MVHTSTREIFIFLSIFSTAAMILPNVHGGMSAVADIFPEFQNELFPEHLLPESILKFINYTKYKK